MARSLESWFERLQDKPVSTTYKIIAVILGMVVVFTLALWGVKTGWSYWWGQGGAIQQKNSTQNFIAAQAQFHRDLTMIAADKQNMKTTQQQISQFNAAHPDYQGNGTPFDPLAQQLNTYQTVLAGQQQTCQATVADYDTAAQSYLTQDWRDANLPSQLDAATECQP